MASRGFLGAGDLYIARYNPALGNFEAYRGPYEATKLEIKPNVELRELSSRGRVTYGQVIESVPLAQPADFTVDLPEVNRESLTIALLGTASTINVGAGTVTDEVVLAKLDGWVQLSRQNLNTAGFVLTNSGNTTTYVLNTDYEVNYRLGMLRVKSGRGITEDQSLRVDFANSAITGTRIRGATNTQIRAKFLLDGVNFADQLPVRVEIFEAVIAADSAFDFLSNDFATISLPGRLKTPAGRTEPFEVQLLDNAI
jgi:hypothetical protein